MCVCFPVGRITKKLSGANCRKMWMKIGEINNVCPRREIMRSLGDFRKLRPIIGCDLRRFKPL